MEIKHNSASSGKLMENIYEGEGIVLPEEFIIADISDERLLELYKMLRPIVTINEIKYLLRKYKLDELKNQSYTWSSHRDKRDIVDPSKLEPIEDFLCLHSYGSYVLFKPSIKEVLSQAPITTLRYANTFEIVERPASDVHLNMYKDVINKGYHLSKVRSYYLHK